MMIFKEKPLFITTILSASLLLLSLLLIILNIHKVGSPVILHFDIFRGIDLFGNKIDIWFFWLSSLLIAFLNSALGEIFFYKERILSYLLVSSNLLFALITLVAVGVIITVN